MAISEQIYSYIKQNAVSLIEFKRETEGYILKYQDIDDFILRAFQNFHMEIDEEARMRMFIDIEYQFKVVHTEGESIFDNYDDPHDWYTKSNKGEQYFWNRYREHLINHTSIDINSINLLDEKTLPDIMNCLCDPKEEVDGKQLRRGLIIGDVQSGKTATYSGLICKAADAGYKVVILLAGITESLRQQTQERIDEGIIGFSVTKENGIEMRGRVGVGKDNKPLLATSFTSCASDFVGDCDKISTSLESHKSLVMFVVKKNVAVLSKLYKWLKDQNLDPVLGYVNNPMLLIDDEADNASVNTNSADVDPTRTNKIIRNICGLFKTATYVGFTATPFANVFIDPDSVDKMKQADLFPEHFIYALPTPSSYIGADKIFYDDGPYYGNLRYISDIEEPDYTSDEYKHLSKYEPEVLNSGPFYSKHKKEWNGDYPKTLRESILCFFLANAVRDLRGQSGTPRSMLINMSRFVRVQNRILDEVNSIWNAFFNTVRYDFDTDINKSARLPLYLELKTLWEKHFSTITDISFERVSQKQTLLNAVEKIERIVVNGARGSKKLNYKSNKSLRVIAVGGLALSRGLTLEGLLVSYFYRNTSTFDVLMQMGRWFGYRPGYEDLFQIWTSKTSADWYSEISRASIALKEDIHTMCEQKLTPKDFGIKVRDNCEELQITSANKMRSSYSLNVLESYYGNMYDTPYISLNTKQNHKNWKEVNTFTKNLFDKGYNLRFADIGRYPDSEINSNIGTSRFFENVPKCDIVDFLSKINCSLVNMNFNIERILGFINDPETKGLDLWDVVFEGGDSSKHYDIDSLTNIQCVQRAIYCENKNVIQISSRRRLTGTREGKFTLDKKELEVIEGKCRKAWIDEDGLSEGEANARAIPLKAYFKYSQDRKPVLIIMLIQPNGPCGDEKKKLEKFREELGDEKLIAFAIGFPGVKDVGNSKHFMVNKVYYNLYMQDDIDETEEVNDEQ